MEEKEWKRKRTRKIKKGRKRMEGLMAERSTRLQQIQMKMKEQGFLREMKQVRLLLNVMVIALQMLSLQLKQTVSLNE